MKSIKRSKILGMKRQGSTKIKEGEAGKRNLPQISQELPVCVKKQQQKFVRFSTSGKKKRIPYKNKSTC